MNLPKSTYECIFYAYTLNSNLNDALLLAQLMSAKNIKPTNLCYEYLIKMCADLNEKELCKRFFDECSPGGDLTANAFAHYIGIIDEEEELESLEGLDNKYNPIILDALIRKKFANKFI
eukprot:UN24640